MSIKNLNVKLQEQFNKMCSTGKLFRTKLTGREVWDIYINSFSKENNPVFRDPESSVHNCNHCKNFIRRYGNIVSIDSNYNISSIFDIMNEHVDDEFKDTVKELSNKIRKSKIINVFFETFDELNSLPYEKCNKSQEDYALGTSENVKRYTKAEAELYGVVKPNEIRKFNHLNLRVPAEFVDKSGKSIESIQSDYRDSKNVFKRTMDEISLDTFNLVRDLILQGSLLDGTAHIHKVEKMIPFKEEYENLPKSKRDNWCWVNSYNLPFAKFRNELIGVLCSELSEGEDLNKACQSWNKRVDPANYMKATAPITQKQIDNARKFVEDGGYEESFNRRFAVLDDINVSEIRHINSGNGSVKNASIFDNVKSNKSRHKRNKFDNIEEVNIEKFMSDILPSCTGVEAYLENRHEGNMVTLTTSVSKESKPIFKWDNNYSWTFNGNLAGKSQIKQAVKTAGGAVNGVLRFSIMWAENDGDNSDLDAHCEEPKGGSHIYYADTRSRVTKGNLDIDITNPVSQMPNGAVENITYPSLDKMIDGTYKFYVRQFSASNSKGFKAEIEFDGEIYSYSYDRAVSGNIQVAEVILQNGEFTINHKLPETNSSKEIYGLNTNDFHKVNLVCLSPNHWGSNNIGNKHYFFMLDNCKTNQSIRSFHNENLKSDLLTHRKVMEVLAATNNLEPVDNQLSGLGFNSTVRDEVILKLSGNFKRVIRVKF